MSVAYVIFEVMDKEPALGLVLLLFLSIGGAGMVMGRRHPILSIPFLAIELVMGYVAILELTDGNTAQAIRHEGGFVYVALSYFAIVAGIVMPLVGAVIGARRVKADTPGWRWLSGLVAVPLLGLSGYLAYGYAKDSYYAYYLWPIEKAGEGYVMPLRWQDVVALLGIWSVVIGLLATSIYLLRFSLKAEGRLPENLQ